MSMIDLSRLSPSEQFVFRWRYPDKDYQSSFKFALAMTIARADEENRALLATLYPDCVNAMRHYFDTKDWWLAVEQKAQGLITTGTSRRGSRWNKG